jgi:hypothetical protein
MKYRFKKIYIAIFLLNIILLFNSVNAQQYTVKYSEMDKSPFSLFNEPIGIAFLGFSGEDNLEKQISESLKKQKGFYKKFTPFFSEILEKQKKTLKIKTLNPNDLKVLKALKELDISLAVTGNVNKQKDIELTITDMQGKELLRCTFKDTRNSTAISDITNMFMNNTIAEYIPLSSAESIASAKEKTDVFEQGGSLTDTYTGNFIGYGSNASGSRIVRINGQTGIITDLFPSPNFILAFTYGEDGTLYGIGKSLYIINLQNGTFTEVGKFKYNNETILMTTAAISNDGVLYVVENPLPKRVFKVNLSTAALTYVGNHPDGWNLAFAPDGTLYGGAFQLYSIDKSNMSVIKKIGDYGAFMPNGLSFGKDGILYGCKDSGSGSSIYSIDLNTGKLSKCVQYNSISIRGLTAERTIKK